MAKKVNVDELMIELGYEGFGFSKRAKIFITKHKISKEKMITLKERDFDDNYFGERYKGFLRDIANVLSTNGYPKLLEELNEPSDIRKQYMALGFTDDFNWGTRFFWAIINNNISLEELCEMSYEQLLTYDGVGYEKAKIIKSELEKFGHENKIVIGLSPEEEKIERTKNIKELKEKLVQVLIEKSNLDPINNKYDKWLVTDYKKTLKDVTIKGLESKIRQLEEL